MQNQQAVMTALNEMKIENCPMPEAKAGEVVIQICYVGICGSDMHFFRTGKIGKKVIESPFVLGHECAGIVYAVGSGVQGLAVGDRVTAEPGIPCGECDMCRKGHYNLCPDMRFMASPPNNGCMRRYMAYPERMVFKLPDNVSLLHGAMIEPLAVGLYAAQKGKIGLGKTAAILGGGPIGMMTLLACRAMGACSIIVSDLFENRLENARRLGAQAVICAAKEDTVEIIMEKTGGRGVDVVFETAGNSTTLQQGVQIAARNGVLVLVGNQTEQVPVDFMSMMTREVSIRTIYRYCNIFPIAIEALSAGSVDMSLICPKVFPFERSEEAFQYTIEHGRDLIKSVIEINNPENA